MRLQENEIFASRYRLERMLGRGGYSEVWLAEDTYTSLLVALKIYAPGAGLDEEGVKLFSQEFALVFNLNHSNLLKPSFYDTEERMPYLVLPYCRNGSAHKEVGRMSEEEAWKFFRDAAAGLEYLHMQDPPLIHQDIKPDNVLIDDNGRFLITDFGISTRIRSTLRKSVQQTSNTGGTLAYMGPERFGKHPAPIIASDIWSLGATVFELITGYPPFDEHGGIVQKSGADLPEIGENCSSELKELITACLALEPWDRPTAAQIREYVETRLRGEHPRLELPSRNAGGPAIKEEKIHKNAETKMIKESREMPPPIPKKKNPGIAWSIVAGIFILIAGIGLYIWIDTRKGSEKKVLEMQRSAQEQQEKEQAVFESCSSVTDYRQYLVDYPEGRFVTEANQSIHAMEEEAARQQQQAEENKRRAEAQAAEQRRQAELTAWQTPLKRKSSQCPYSLNDRIEVSKIAVTENRCTVTYRYLYVSKYDMSSSELEAMKTEIRQEARSFQSLIPSGKGLTAVISDKAKREVTQILIF